MRSSLPSRLLALLCGVACLSLLGQAIAAPAPETQRIVAALLEVLDGDSPAQALRDIAHYREAGFVYQPALAVSDETCPTEGDSDQRAVLSGMGVAVDMPLVQIYEDLLNERLIPILPGWFLPPIECYIVTSRTAWHMRRVRIFLEWYAHSMQQLFASYESQVSAIVGLPRDDHHPDRERIFRT